MGTLAAKLETRLDHRLFTGHDNQVKYINKIRLKSLFGEAAQKL